MAQMAAQHLRWSNDGTILIKDQKLISNRWAEHFNALLNQQTP